MRPTLGEAFRKAIETGRNLGPNGMPVTQERVTLMLDDEGRVEVRGVRIPVVGAGQRGLRAGDRVAVAWKGRKPVAAIRHSARRSGAVTPSPRGLPVVEELFIATDATTGLVEVWFRNDQQVTNLGLRAAMDADPVYVKWGTRSSAFLVATAAHRYYVCSIARVEEQPLGAAQPAVTIVRSETPLDQGIVLVNRQDSFSLSGETKYFVSFVPSPPDDKPVLSETTANPITASLTTVGQVFLTRLLIEGQLAPLRPPRALITDIALDDNLEMIWCLSVDFSGGPTPSPPIVPPPVAPLSNHPIEKSDNSGQVQSAASDDALDQTGNALVSFGSHLFVVNVSTGTVLFKTCVDTLVQHANRQVTRFQTYRNEANPTQEQDFPSTFPYTAKNGNPYQVIGPFSGQLADVLTYTDLVSDFTTTTRPGIVSFTVNEYDTAQVPYVDVVDLWGLDTTTLGGLVGHARVSRTFTGRRYWAKRRYQFSGVYLPRRATATGALPRGLLVLKVRRVAQPAFLPSLSDDVAQGLFLHDLAGGAITTLVPFTTNFYNHASLQIPPLNIFFHTNAPETTGAFVVLGFNGTHLFWLHGRQETFGGPNLVDIKLTNVVTGTTTTVLSGSLVEVDGETVLDETLRAFLARNFQTLRPDFFYYASESDTAGNNFVEAWDVNGVPTLDAAAPDFPPIDAALEPYATLQALETIIPVDDTILTRNGGPINVEDLTQTGPVWQVIQDASVLGAALTADP